jgi:hypothetical protein
MGIKCTGCGEGYGAGEEKCPHCGMSNPHYTPPFIVFGTVPCVEVPRSLVNELIGYLGARQKLLATSRTPDSSKEYLQHLIDDLRATLDNTL